MISWIFGTVICIILFFMISKDFAWICKFIIVGWILNSVVGILILFGLWYKDHTDEAVRKAHSFINFTRKTLLGLSIELKGKEILERERASGRNFVIVCNHQSVLDILVMGELWSHLDRIRVAVKAEFLKLGFAGVAMKICGAVFVDRKASVEGRASLNKAVLELKKSNSSLFVFPEGTRHFSRDLKLLPFKKGAFHAAFDGNLPILPVVIGHYDFLDHDKHRFDSGKITIQILEPIEIDGLEKGTNLERIVNETHEKMTTCFNQISNNKCKSD